jgi:hypothetical protein
MKVIMSCVSDSNDKHFLIILGPKHWDSDFHHYEV